MQLTPRSYQVECVGAVYQYFVDHQTGNPVCALPTGTGKSVIIAMFLESVFRHYKNQKVLCLTHVKELIEQNYSKLLQLWPSAPAGVNSAGLGRRDTAERIIFAGIASVAKTAAQFGHVDLIIIDEAHLVSPSDQTMYQTFIAALTERNPALRVIGFTATPWRLGHGRITEESIFTDLCFDITGMEPFNRLIAEGYLARLTPKRTQTVLDIDGVHMRGGEFIASELQTAVNKDEITRAALHESIAAGVDRKHWLIFASGVQHAETIADMLTDLGVPCRAVHSKMAGGERDKVITDFKAGRLRAVVNNNVLTTGFDMPGIDFIIMLRPTASPVLWVQMLGRGTRPCLETGKTDCLVLDFAGNTKRLGPINDPVIPRKKGEGKGEAPVKTCDVCDTICHASVRFCPTCKTEFVASVKLKTYASTEELIKGDMPVTETFKVDHISYSQHNKAGKPPAVKVSYFCGVTRFQEYVCLEHGNYAERKAKLWVRERDRSSAAPATTAALLACIDNMRTPTHIRVWVNKEPYPEIMAFDFDGTAFGKYEAADSDAGPTVETVKPESITDWRSSPVTNLEDDDIPF